MSIIGALPYTFTNGTTADANQVNADFSTVVTGVNTNAAKNGANADITSLSAISTPISVGQGGTGNTTGQPSGTAGGALTGSYPNPTLAGAQRILNGTVIATTGSFTIPAAATSSTVFEFTVIGGGGAGGGATTTTTGGGGGGSGGVGRAWISGFTASSSVSITIGGGGTGSSGANGGGGNTSKITYNSVDVITSNGGQGGPVNGGVGSGVSGTAGSVTISAGASGLTIVASIIGGAQPASILNPSNWSGTGGANPYGTGGNALVVNHDTAGVAGTNGCGGGGAVFATGNQAGGAGGGGLVIIQYVL